MEKSKEETSPSQIYAEEHSEMKTTKISEFQLKLDQELAKEINSIQEGKDQQPKKNKRTPPTEERYQTFDKETQLSIQEKILSKIEIRTEELKINCPKNYKDVIGKNPGLSPVYLSLKNHNSFLQVFNFIRVKLIENAELIFAGKFKDEKKNWVRDVSYQKSLNCYLLALDFKIYRKDIDRRPCYLFLDLKCGLLTNSTLVYYDYFRREDCLRYSKLNKKLIVNNGKSRISVLDMSLKKVNAVLKIPSDEALCDFQLLGDREDRLVTITQKGELNLFKILTRASIFKMNFYLDLVMVRKKIDIFVDPNNKFIIVQTGNLVPSSKSSILRILRVNDSADELELVRMVKKHQCGFYGQFKFCFCGQFAGKSLVVGLGLNLISEAEIFLVDSESLEFGTVEGKTVELGEKVVMGCCRLGDDIYYTGSHAKLMKLKLELI